MKQSLAHRDPRIIFREIFRSEQQSRKLGALPPDNAFVYKNGYISLVPSNNEFIYPVIHIPKTHDWSFRIKFRLTSIFTEQGIFGNDFSPNNYEYFGVTSDGVRWSTDGNNTLLRDTQLPTLGEWIEYTVTYKADSNLLTMYRGNTEVSSLITNSNFTFRDLGGIGIESTDTWRMTGDIDFIEVYNAHLTEEEVKNLYEGKTYRELPDKANELLGDNLVINGGFDIDLNWTTNGSWIISNGVASATANSGNNVLGQLNIGDDGDRFAVQFDVTENTLEGTGTALDFPYTEEVVSFTKEELTIGTHQLILTQSTTSFLSFRLRSGMTGGQLKIDNVTVKQIIHSDLEKVLDISALKGVVENKLNNELTLTDIDIKQISSGIYAPEFNGNTSKIDCGDIDDLTGDITVLAWINSKTLGSSNVGVIIDNGKLIVRVYSAGMQCASDGSTFATFGGGDHGGANLNNYQLIAIVRKSDGSTTCYNNTTQKGVSGVSGGPPAAGTTNLIIGNRNAGGRTFDGKIPSIKIYKGLLSLQQITQFWSNTKKYFE